MDEDYLLNFKWDKFVGRRQPPLRGFIVYEGFIKWLNKRFDYNFSNLFLFFSTKKGSDIITDSFVNVQLKNKLLELIVKDIKKDIKPLYNDLKQFEKDTSNLLQFSKTLSTLKDTGNLEIFFDKFYELWRDFSPSLLFIIFLEEACENEVIKNQKDREEARADLFKEISSDLKSVLFDINKKLDNNKKQISFPEESRKYIILLKNLIKFRDLRKKIYDDCWYKYSKDFFTILGKMTGLDEHIDWVSPSVVKKSIVSKNNFIFENNAVIFFDNIKKKIDINYGKSVLTLKEKIVTSLIKSEIKGNIACNGFARGKVRIVEPHTRVEVFNEGEVIVSKMTTPDLILVIKKASAIVTDEGGVTSHAAVISRELNIPCIVGTKTATKVFKDGDLIEVDANKGIIKKLK